MMIKPGEEIHGNGGQRLRVIDVVRSMKRTIRRSSGCYRSKAPPRTTNAPLFGHVIGRRNAARTE